MQTLNPQWGGVYTNYANHSLKIMHPFDENNVMKNNFIGNTEKKVF